MKYKKGFLGAWIAVLVAGALAIAGGSYYLGKTSNPISDNSFPEEIPDDFFTNTTKDEITKDDCKKTDAPWIKVLSPNGGETYTMGEEISIKWKSCNASNTRIFIEVYSPKTTSLTLMSDIDNGIENDGLEKIKLSTSTNASLLSGDYELRISAGGLPSGELKDSSDGTFKIKSSVSTVLPKYIGSHSDCGSTPCWPPVVVKIPQPYSCNNIGIAPNTEGNNVVAERLINGRKYCIHTLKDGYAGGTGYTYAYTTSNGAGTKKTTFGITYQSCGVYGGPSEPTVVQCQSNQNTFKNNLDSFIDNLIQS